MMVSRRTNVLITSILAAGLCGIFAPVLAQDPGAPAAADPAADPFMNSTPAGTETTFDPSFGAPAAPAAPEAASPVATAPDGAITPGAVSADAVAAGEVTSPFASAPGAAPVAPAPADATAATAAAPATGGPTAGTGNTANNGKGISQLYEFRYVPSASFNGRKIVTRKQMTRDEAAAFDTAVAAEFAKMAEEGVLPNKRFNKATGNSQEWGQWMLYAFQLENWATYCSNVALGGTNFKFDPNNDIKWPGDPTKQELAQATSAGGEFAGDGGSGKGGGGRPERPKNIYNENRSLDDQVMDFVPVPDTRGGQGQQPTVVDPKQMDDQTKEIYNRFLTALRAEEKRQTEFLKKLANDIDQRARDRASYAEWRDNQKHIVMDYVNDWNRRYEGKVVTVAGVRYELYKPGTVPKNTTRYANIVVTDYELTPYDLLNEDGSLRGPAK